MPNWELGPEFVDEAVTEDGVRTWDNITVPFEGESLVRTAGSDAYARCRATVHSHPQAVGQLCPQEGHFPVSLAHGPL